MKYVIRRISDKDNSRMEYIIRSCLIEFGGNHEGTAWADPDLGRFSEIYNGDNCAYWVAENEDGIVIGGVGIGQLLNVQDTCELQKMYCVPAARGTGISHLLIQQALSFAEKHYSKCYLETLESMKGAQKFYGKYGFMRVENPLTETGHDACSVRYIKYLGT